MYQNALTKLQELAKEKEHKNAQATTNTINPTTLKEEPHSNETVTQPQKDTKKAQKEKNPMKHDTKKTQNKSTSIQNKEVISQVAQENVKKKVGRPKEFEDCYRMNLSIRNDLKETVMLGAALRFNGNKTEYINWLIEQDKKMNEKIYSKRTLL